MGVQGATPLCLLPLTPGVAVPTCSITYESIRAAGKFAAMRKRRFVCTSQ
jgi:hypothetical protein